MQPRDPPCSIALPGLCKFIIRASAYKFASLTGMKSQMIENTLEVVAHYSSARHYRRRQKLDGNTEILFKRRAATGQFCNRTELPNTEPINDKTLHRTNQDYPW
jgi:hypothetical protein